MNPVRQMDQSLAGWIVVEVGDRRACSACGQLLAHAGATVIVIEPVVLPFRDKWLSRASFLAGKRSVVWREADGAVLETVVNAADIVLLSSDIPTPMQTAVSGLLGKQHIVCDITAAVGPYGVDLSGLSDKLIQAYCGMATITGMPELDPAVSDVSILEFHAGAYAAAAVAAGMRAKRLFVHNGQRIDVGLYECGVNALATFLPLHYGGKTVSRAGNRHPMAAPWNAYRADDGWVLICSATDEHWTRLCEVMGVPGLAREGSLTKLVDRVRLADEVDRHVSKWTAGKSVDDIITTLNAVGIASGPIVEISKVRLDANVQHRKMALSLPDPLSGVTVTIPGTPLKASRTPGRHAEAIPAPDADRAFVTALAPRRQSGSGHRTLNGACSGLTIIEIGQYTTAPLATKHFAALGAEVIKVEPLSGEATRQWPPLHDGIGYFFSMSNNGKRSAALDLRDPADAEVLANIIKRADVLIENLKPGSLQKLGFSPEALERLNPRLVYCGISGFGADSVYPGRPAFDSVIQAMSGLMDLTKIDGTPVKLGISAADITGALVAFFAILAMLEYRDRTGVGQAIDLAMQDAALWTTQTHWNSESKDPFQMVSTAGGLAASAFSRAETSGAERRLSAEKEAARIVPVRTVSEVADDPITSSSGLVVWKQVHGFNWPLLAPPYRLSVTPASIRELIGELGELNDELRDTSRAEQTLET